MPRRARAIVGGLIYHVLNRSNSRTPSAGMRTTARRVRAICTQGRFKSFPIEQDEHFYTVARYVERNPLRAQLVERAEDWRYGSLWLRSAGAAAERSLLAQWPLPLPRQWTAHVNGPQTEAEAEAVRRSISKSAPFGGEAWTRRTVAALGLEHTQRPRGRPPKPRDDIRLPSPLVLRMSPFLFQIASVHSAHPIQQFASRRDA